MHLEQGDLREAGGALGCAGLLQLSTQRCLSRSGFVLVLLSDRVRPSWNFVRQSVR